MPDHERLADVNDLRRRLGGDDELIAELFRIFLEEYPAQLATLDTAVASRNGDAVSRGAHHIKSSLGNLSAVRAAEAAAALESAGENSRVAAFDDLFATLTNLVHSLAAEVRAHLGAESNARPDRG